MINLTYPVKLIPDEEGGYIAEIPDVPGTFTIGDDEKHALYWIEDALHVMLSTYIEDNQDIPQPSKPKRGQPTVTLPPLAAAKLAIYQAMRDQDVTQVELANRLQCDPKQVRRLLDLDHNSRLDQLENALKALGKKLVVHILDAA